MSDDFKCIKGTINCSKINKARLFTKEGKEGKYLKIVLIKKRDLDKYGQIQFMIKEDVTMEQSNSGIEGAIIGDASALKPRPKAAPADVAEVVRQFPKDEDVPF